MRKLHKCARMCPGRTPRSSRCPSWASPSQHYGRMHQRPEPEISAFDTKNRALGLGYDILALFAEQWCPAISVLGLSALRIGQVAEELTARVHHQQIEIGRASCRESVSAEVV